MNKEIITPCIGICSYNADGLCAGCFRTCDEIVNWFDMSDDERKSVMLQLDSRAESSFD